MGEIAARTLVHRFDALLRRAACRVALGCAVALPLGAAQAQEPVTLRFATFLPPNGIFTGADGVIARWGKAIEQDSGGRMSDSVSLPLNFALTGPTRATISTS